MRERIQIEWGKLGLLSLVIVGGFVLVLVAIVSMSADDDRFGPILALGTSQIAGAVGYLTGNGRLASRGESSVPTFAPAPAKSSPDISKLTDPELLAQIAELAREVDRRRAEVES
jgi:hypothetical protein